MKKNTHGIILMVVVSFFLFCATAPALGAGEQVFQIISKADRMISVPNAGNKVTDSAPDTFGEALDWATNATNVATATSGAVSTATSSAAGAMSTLSSAAPFGAFGAVGGMATLAGSGGLAAAGVMNKTVFKDDPSLPVEEQEARGAGRIGTYTGAAAGTAAGVAAVSAAGTAGLSAAGITSGLATIGAGSMAAGTIAVVAAPAVVAVAVGYGFYAAYQYFSND